MDSFLGRNAFTGPVIDADAAGSHFVGQARFSGCITFTNWPRAEVEAILPGELELVPNTTAPALHPVVFVFGDQADGAVLFAGFTVPTGAMYPELGVVVPFVRHRGGRHLHNYVPRMYASFFPAVWHGNTHYGFSKETAALGWRGPVFLVTGEDGSLLLHADVEPTGTWAPAARTDTPNFDAMRAVFVLPALGRRADGRLVSSYFDWDFTNAHVRPVDACVSIDASFLPGLRPGLHHDAPAGTFEVRDMIWRLSWPEPCRP